MKYRDLLKREFKRSGGKATIAPLDKSNYPSAASLKALDREIASQINANNAMRSRSMKKG